MWHQYDLIRDRLKEALSENQMKFIPDVRYQSDFALLGELDSAAGVASAYLRSLEGSLEKELEAKERSLAVKEAEVDRLWKFLIKSAEIMKEVPEARRSEWVAGMKKAHREIEEYSKPKPEDGKE